MRIVNPAMLIWAAALALPILLYLFRRKPKEFRVSTLPFFKALAREHQESEWLRRLKRLISFLLTAAVILFAVAALAQVVFTMTQGGKTQTVVIMIDRSASMAARDGGGSSRLDDAVSAAKRRLDGVAEGTSIAVVAYDRRAEVVQSLTHNRRSVVRALDTLTVRPIDGDLTRALAFSRRIAELDSPGVIWLFTDGPAPVVDPDGPLVETVSVGLEEPVNAGLTAFALRPSPMSIDEYEAFVQIQGVSSEPQEVELEVRLDDELISLRTVSLKPGQPERLLVPVAVGNQEVISLYLKSDGDALPLDDELHAWVPKPEALTIHWVAPDPSPFTQMCLTTLGTDSIYNVYHQTPDAWTPETESDLIIFDGWLPETLPAGPPLIIIDPPTADVDLGLARLTNSLPTPGVRTILDDHPVTYAIGTDRLSLMQTAVISSRSPLTPLWRSVAGPLLAAGDYGGRRVVLMAFAPDNSEQLPLLTAWPVLMGNAILWATDPSQQSRLAQHQPTGTIVQAESGTIELITPRRGEAPLRRHAEGGSLELADTCLWQVDATTRGSASLLSPRETQLSTRSSADPAAVADAPAQASKGLPLSGEWFLWLALLALIVENILFHRFAVY